MSSSSTIWAQIVQCKNEITYCEDQICELKISIVEKEDTYKIFQRKADNFSSILARKKRKSESVFEFSERSKLAKEYSYRIGFEFNEKNGKEQQLIDIDEQMKQEIQNNQNELRILEGKLSSLKSRLSSLESEYRAALRREEEERNAAAAQSGYRR